MRGWRLLHRRHAAHAASGEGARLYGGRWNSPGRPVIYTAASLSLAALELLVHVRSPTLLRQDYVSLWLEFPADTTETHDAGALPMDWRRPEHPELKRLGDRWLSEARSLALIVPSAVIPEETNYLINPLHPDFAKVAVGTVQAFHFDERLGA